MNEVWASIIIATITGIFSVVTLIIQKSQDKTINKIDNQISMVEKEKELREQIRQMEDERSELIQRAIILLLKANAMLITHLDENSKLATDIVEDFKELELEYQKLTSDIEEKSDEHKIVLEASKELKKELEALKNKKS